MSTSERRYRIVSLPGDGIGPEVSAAALEVLTKVGKQVGIRLQVDEHLIGGEAIDQTGEPLPPETRSACKKADAVLLGAVGGPKWDDLAGDMRPESGLLALRKLLGTFANLRPVRVPDALTDASPLRPDVIAGVDLLVVRELTGGIYFGKPSEEGEDTAASTMRYDREEIKRIAEVAFEWSRRRTGRVASIDKANVLAVSRLWRNTIADVHATDHVDVELSHYYVDNAAMQIVLKPGQFDVILTGNLFGDILSDLSAALTGSLGMLPSASVGSDVGIFEPVHGSAPDIAGRGIANPIAMILSTAMMLDALGETPTAEAIRQGVDGALAEGLRTADLTSEDDASVTTKATAKTVAEIACKSLNEKVHA